MPQFPEIDRIASILPLFNGGMIATHTHCSAMHAIGTITTTVNWPAANLGIYVPVIITERVTVVQLGWFNGSVITSSADAGIYDINGTRIVSTGPTAQVGTTAWQFVNITDTVLGPGCFYFALSLNGTNRLGYLNAASVVVAQIVGVAEEASVATLPAIATMVATTRVQVPVIAAMIDGTA